MGTKTVDETGAEPGTEAKSDQKNMHVTKEDTAADAVEATEAVESVEEAAEDELDDLEPLQPAAARKTSHGVGQGAAGIVSVALGIVSLTGSWVGTVASAREGITGALEMQAAPKASVATRLQALYGDSWQATALWGGIFALVALLVGVGVLVRPAFGDPDQVQAPWIKSVAWAGVSVGFIGLLLAVLKYSDVLLGLPSTG
ncbi:hypothetical protein SGFS_040420 [Streptomyces graminofaciens]|jgi:hypothetical protein|uniref:Integral membrane protein n=1 Tax=Streptomyces graminofaciens TaxID=68212 RepID=A0ABN5VIA1_9ACTN|nr:hypothetical protein [Streptomyces graminofaciens]BBC32748.1 hypothetical protein SGFS_040420 [Streptomyces graminofaciens]